MKEKLKKIRFAVTDVFSKHEVFVVLAVLLAVAGLVVFRLSSLSSIEPDQAYIDDQTFSVKPVQFNEEAIEKIEALRDSNVKDLGTQVQEDRQNPFSE
jgi:hypothetical protein